MEPRLPSPATGPYSFSRLQALVDRIKAGLPDASASDIIEGSFEFNSTTVTFRNGLQVLVSVDPDLPEALYEVIRLATPGGVQRYPFEMRTGFGSAFSNRLSSEAVLELLRQYASQQQLDQAGNTEWLPNSSG